MSQPPRLNPGAFAFVPGQIPLRNAQGQNPAGAPPPQGGNPPPQPGGSQYPYGQQQQQQPFYGQYGQYAPPYGGQYAPPPQGGYPGGPQGGYGYGPGPQSYQPPHLRQQQYSQQSQYASPPQQQQQSQFPPPPSNAAPPTDLAPIERQEQITAPTPAPTIKLNIGGGSSIPKPPTTEKKDATPGKTIKLNIGGGGGGSGASSGTSTPAAAPVKAAPAPAAPKVVPAASSVKDTPAPAPAPAAASSTPSTTAKVAKDYNFSADKAKTDADAILHDTLAVADQETLKDLYGDGGDAVDPNVKIHMNVVFVGHVDAGKSTLGGQLLYLTDMVDKRTMEKLEREAKEAGRETWYLSWALDSTTQERAKGKTVEVGRAYFETNTRRYTILDAPGHKTYVPSMISGAAQADVAILVISARKGEFETGFEKGGQTREHIMLVKTAGVSKLIVVINKMDDITVEWAEERYNEVKEKLTPFVRAAGFNPKTDLTFIPISAYTAVNVKDRASPKIAPWWNGPSLLELLDSMPIVDRKINGPVMMPISEKYKDLGTVVVGKLESGRIKKGDSLIMMPNRVTVEVAAMYNESEVEVLGAFGGDNVRIRLRGIEDEDVSPGFVLSSPGAPVRAVRRFEAQLAILDHKNIICAGYSAVMHVHTLAEDVSLAALLHYFDKKTGRKSKKPPQFAKRGQKIIAQIETTDLICVERFADYPQLGRFTLRDEGKTVAIGKVTRLLEADEHTIADGVASIALGGPTTAASST